MRHSDPRLTFGVYVHSDKARLKAAVEALPGLGTVDAEGEEPVAKGA